MSIDYDTLFLTAGEEMYNYPMFIRNFHVWKISHLVSRIVPITEKFQLPWHSVLHVLDNIQYPQSEIQDAPRLNTNPFFLHEKYRKWIYHVTNFQFSTEKVHMPVDIDFLSGKVTDTPTEKKYIYRTAKLMPNLMAFRRQYGSTFRYLYDIATIPTMKESFTIINHNPLFRVSVYGKLKLFRKLQFIFGSLVNIACQIPSFKNQYIHIPLTTRVFPRQSFLRSQKDLSLLTIKYPENYHYLVMMNFLNLINPNAHTSLFEKIPESHRKSITFIFTVGNNAIFYNVNDLLNINVKNKAYIRIINQFNLLSMSHTEEVQKVIKSVPDDEDIEDGTTAQGDTNNTTSIINDQLKEAKNKLVKIKSINAATKNDNINKLNDALSQTIDIFKEKEQINKSKISDINNITTEEDYDPLSLEESEEYEDVPDNIDADIKDDNKEDFNEDEVAIDTQELIDVLVEHDKQYQANKRKKQVTTGVVQAKQRTDKQNITNATPIEVEDVNATIETDINNVVINSPCVKVFNETVDEGKARSIAYLEELDMQAEQLIDNIEELTPAQKERYIKLSKVYKDIVIGNKTVGQWLTDPPNTSLKDIELDFLKDQVPDKGMLKSSVVSLDDTYMQNTFGRDLLACATSFSKNGVFLIDIDAEPITTELNKLVKYTFKYEDVNGKTSSVQLTIPQVNKHGYLFINGKKKILKKQMVNLPIIKVSNTRVSLASAFNKTIVERNVTKAHSFTAYVSTILSKLSALPDVQVDRTASSIFINKPFAYEYTSLAREYRTFSVFTKQQKYIFYFDYNSRMEFFCNNNTSLIERVTHFENKYKSVLCCKDKEHLGFIDVNNTINFMDSTGVIVHHKKSTILSLLKSMSDKKLTSTPLTEFTTLKLRDKNLPIIFVLAYQYGLVTTLNYLKCHWLRIGKLDKRVIQDNNPKKETPPIPGMKLANESLAPGDKYIVKSDDILIPFQNEYLVINRYPLIQSLIVAGLSIFDTKLIKFEDMENVSTYFTLLEMKGYPTSYLKAITGFFGYFIDPMTRDKLELMKEPTNCRDLLIRSTQLLATEDHRQPSSVANHCLRSYERLNVIMYNEMARALEEYQINGGAGSKFSINPHAVFQRIITDQAMMNVEELGVVHDIKEKSGFTYTGVGGRTAQSFVLKDRQYPDDGIGVISETSVDSGNVGIVAQTSMDPSIVNTRGMFEHKDPNELEPTQVFSIAALLMPGATNDDGKRTSFISHQLSHHLCTFSGDVCRVRTGYERVIAHRTSDNFVCATKFDGVVEEIDTNLKMVRIKYTNGETDVFSYKDLYTGSSGLVIEQQLELAVKEGQKVKKGDIVVYNKLFFKKDPYSTQVDWKHGVMANVVIAERNTTLEDSNGISTRLGEKFGIAPIEIVAAVMNNDSIVHQIVQIGTVVRKGDVLVTFEDGDLGDSLTINAKDEETLAMIQSMNRNNTTASVSGTIVDIDAYYGCPIQEMHPTLAKIVKSIANFKNARNKYCAGTDAEYNNPKTGPMPKGERYKGIDINQNTVILRFFIRHVVGAGVGDKLVYDSSLKSVISSTFPEPMLTQSGVEVDAVFSGTGIMHRVITSPLIVGSLQRVLEKTEKNMIEMWRNNKV